MNEKLNLAELDAELKKIMDDTSNEFITCLNEDRTKEACDILEQKLNQVIVVFEKMFDESFISGRIETIYGVKLAALLVALSYSTTVLGNNYGLIATGLIDTMRDLMLLLADPFSYTSKEKKDSAKDILDNFLTTLKSNTIN